MKICILGGTGLLGQALQRELADHDVIATGSLDADIRERNQILRLQAYMKPDWMILAAAFTDVDGCERDPERAASVNSLGPKVVAEIAEQNGIRLVFVSTDYVFDGSKRSPWEVSDAINPINVYGRTKAEGERAVRESGAEALIVRTSWLFGTEGKCFPRTLLELASTRKDVSIVDDQRGAPTYNLDLARAIHRLISKDARGTVHASNRGDCTWYELAWSLVRRAGIETTTIKAISTETLNRPAVRPAYSVLSPTSLHDHGIEMRHWRDAVSNYVDRVHQTARFSAAASR
jgi:dTDP-4-dehydrorhamnose reductase